MTAEHQDRVGRPEEYWRAVHHDTPSDLAAVCFPDRPVWYSAFYDRIQKRAVSRALRACAVPSLSGRRTLDLGCGRGRWLEFFADEHGAAAEGVDISPVAVRSCVERGLLARVASVEALPQPSGSAALVTSVTVLMHVSRASKTAAAAEIARVLAPGGLAIILEGTQNDPAPHVFNLPVAAWHDLFMGVGLRPVRTVPHCFTLAHRRLPVLPARDLVATCLDYPLERVFEAAESSGTSRHALQHVMVYRKGQP